MVKNIEQEGLKPQGNHAFITLLRLLLLGKFSIPRHAWHCTKTCQLEKHMGHDRMASCDEKQHRIRI